MNTRILGSAILLAGFAISTARADWTIQTVDSGSNVGRAASLILSSSGTPHISYIRPNTSAGFSDVFYATRSGSTWTTESVYAGFSDGGAGQVTSIALTDQGRPAISFSRAVTFLEYSVRTAGGWPFSPTDVTTSAGGYSSLLWQGTEASPTPIIAYYDNTAGDLKLASLSGSWSSQTLDSTGDSGKWCSLAMTGGYYGIAYVDAGKLGFYESFNGSNWGAYSDNQFTPFSAITNVAACALALAPTKNNMNSAVISAHIIYYDGSSYKYETNDTSTGTWASPVTIKTVGASNGLFGLSIAVGSDGVVHAAYLDYSTGELAYATLQNNTWTAETVATSSGANCTLRLDSSNSPHIAYSAFDGSNVVTALKYAERPTSTSGGSTSSTPLSFTISGKAKRLTSALRLSVQGSASASAIAIEWKLPKMAVKKISVSGGNWRAKVGPLLIGTNRVQFRAVGADGSRTAYKRITITRQ